MELPLWFIIILLLIICFLLYYLYNCLEVEAFGPHNSVEEPLEVTLSGITDASAIKLSDDFFYFIDGAQIVQLSPDTNSTEIQNNMNDVNKYIFYSRQGNIKVVEKAGDNITVDSSVLEKSYADFYRSQQIEPISGGIINNQLFYIPFGNSTFIYVVEHPKIDQEGQETHRSFYSVHGNIQMKTHAYPADGNYSSIISKDSVTFTSGQVSNNYETAKVSFKDVDIHQIQPNVFYHYDSGTLLIKEQDKIDTTKFILRMIKIPTSTTLETEEFAGTDEAKLELKDKIPGLNSNINGFTFLNSYVYPDILGGNLILYLKNGAKTAICTLRRNSSGMYDLIGVVRFNGTQLNSDFGSGDENVDDEENEDNDDNDDGDDDDDDEEDSDEDSEEDSDEQELPGNMDDYYKWYWYWNTSGSMPVHFSEDYMLKTQVVPPVCPACPSCPNSGNCNNCGGNGGNGTQDSNGKSMVNSKTGSELGGAYSKTLDTASDLLKSAGSGAKSIIDNTMGLSSQAVQGATGLAKNTVQGGVGLAKDTVQGGVGLAKDTVQGAVNVGGDVLETGLDATGRLASGTAGLIRDIGQGSSQLNNIYGSNTQGSNTQGSNTQGSIYSGNRGTYGAPMGSTYDSQSRSPVDPYTYNGKLKNRPSSDFLPRTADFSAFAK